MNPINAITLSSKGQVVLPKHIRTRHNWQAGMTLELEETPEGLLLKTARPFPPTELDQVFGMAKARGRKRSLADMDAAVAAEAVRRK